MAPVSTCSGVCLVVAYQSPVDTRSPGAHGHMARLRAGVRKQIMVRSWRPGGAVATGGLWLFFQLPPAKSALGLSASRALPDLCSVVYAANRGRTARSTRSQCAHPVAILNFPLPARRLASQRRICCSGGNTWRGEPTSACPGKRHGGDHRASAERATK